MKLKPFALLLILSLGLAGCVTDYAAVKARVGAVDGVDVILLAGPVVEVIDDYRSKQVLPNLPAAYSAALEPLAKDFHAATKTKGAIQDKYPVVADPMLSTAGRNPLTLGYRGESKASDVVKKLRAELKTKLVCIYQIMGINDGSTVTLMAVGALYDVEQDKELDRWPLGTIDVAITGDLAADLAKPDSIKAMLAVFSKENNTYLNSLRR